MRRVNPVLLGMLVIGLVAALGLMWGGQGSGPVRLPEPSSQASEDGTVEYAGLLHDSRDPQFRWPQGAVEAGQPVTLRFRTYAGDASEVELRLYSVATKKTEKVRMTKVAQATDCREADGTHRCDYWEHTIPGDHAADNLWYRFVVRDLATEAFYADDTPALDGGPGLATDSEVDQSWALMLHVPGFSSPEWTRDTVVYQIFPDRFRNGNPANDLRPGAVRYDDPVHQLPWGERPEGYCKNWMGASAATCPWRWGTPPSWSQDGVETPRGRDYAGGDLAGVIEQLPMLESLGVKLIYLNPIFSAGSNHAYDTRDYTAIDPAFGTRADFEKLVSEAQARGIRVMLDGVFNHTSSDSPLFDRYGRYATLGACESVDSPYRSWYVFKPRKGGPCAGPDGPNTMEYEAWWGFDTLPVLVKSKPEVQEYFLTGSDAIGKQWLGTGIAGWRLDVANDPSFPDGWWQTFRKGVKQTSADALVIGEIWQKDTSLLTMLRGDQVDSTMNYRLRDAVLGLLAPGEFDIVGFPDSGRRLPPSDFLARLSSMREDYPDAAYFSLMNILDSHDVERVLWSLTEGTSDGAREDPAAMDAAKQRLRLASLVQFTQAGMPTIYYGDEVGMTGAGDPDNRRTYPWADAGGQPDEALRAWYGSLAKARAADPALTHGDFSALLADDEAGTLAYARHTDRRAAVVVVNTSDEERRVRVPVADLIPDGTTLTGRLGTFDGAADQASTVEDGHVEVTLPAQSGMWLSTDEVDLTGLDAPAVAKGTTGEDTAQVTWQPVPGATGYDVWVSATSHGGHRKVNRTPVNGTSFDVPLEPGNTLHVIVRARDEHGFAGQASEEVAVR